MSMSLTSATSSMSRSFTAAQGEIATSVARLGSQQRFQKASQDAASFVLKGALEGQAAIHEGVKGEISRGMAFIEVADAWVSESLNQLSDLKAETSIDPTSDKTTQLRTAAQETLNQTYDGTNLKTAGTFDTVNLAGTASVALTTTGTVDTAALTSTTEIDAAISELETIAGEIGGFRARLEAQDKFSSAMIESSRTAQASLTKIDEAAEMANYVENDVRQQAAISMMSQANMSRRAVTMLYR